MEDSLRRLVEEFEGTPAYLRRLRREMRELYAADPDGFRGAAVPLLKEQPPGLLHLVTFLSTHDLLAGAIADPQLLSLEQAIAVARVAARIDPELTARLARGVSSVEASQGEQGRLLDVLAATGEPGRTLPLLAKLLQHRDPRIRSKAALTLGRLNRNAEWLRGRLSEENSRVRANAVEALWGVSAKGIREIFQDATGDPNPRVAGNAILGLYLAGVLESVPLLLKLAECEEDSRRSTAAWVMGATQDPRFLPPLERMASDADPRVRHNSQRARERIERRVAQCRTAGRLALTLSCLPRTPDGRRTLGLSLEGGAIAALQISVCEDGRPVWEYNLQERHRPPALSIAFAMDTGWLGPCREALVRSLAAKRTSDAWALAAFQAGADRASPEEHLRIFGIDVAGGSDAAGSAQQQPAAEWVDSRAELEQRIQALQPPDSGDLFHSAGALLRAMDTSRGHYRLVLV
ncbi:MAG: HEAT repeat domain-containing protein, partial [Candidatus Solibacter usitatus]|nr:HEAT repeat domain-containing protein [Candidatus Solibacter usitatus]